MLEIRLNITERKILHSLENNGNTKYKILLYFLTAYSKKIFKVTEFCNAIELNLKHYFDGPPFDSSYIVWARNRIGKGLSYWLAGL